ncbi:unnamed protein product [Prunus armeniaca]|uniref:tRNA-splicing endonuclease subunit Sen54 N-terminal domain-containing protein n=1 Tax=Prunus armeniaca TaxID=36596 RepID=A0A6J5UTC3_PRUAR|nr:unnamed protein product [Prunus armeniaca]
MGTDDDAFTFLKFNTQGAEDDRSGGVGSGHQSDAPPVWADPGSGPNPQAAGACGSGGGNNNQVVEALAARISVLNSEDFREQACNFLMGQGEICACGSCLTLNRFEAANDEKIVGDTDESCISKAHWNHEMGMAEVIVLEGTNWKNTGVIQSGNKLYCSIYEVLFLVEKGHLRLLDDSGTSTSLEDIFMKISDENNRWYWEEFQAYRKLKSLGYIVGQYGIPWSTIGVKSKCEFVSSQGCPKIDEAVDFETNDTSSSNGLFNEMQSNEARPVFDVYAPNKNFKKSSPGDPCFVLCFTRSRPPSKLDLEALERQCGSIPLKFCHVDYGSASFFSFDKVELPTLP